MREHALDNDLSEFFAQLAFVLDFCFFVLSVLRSSSIKHVSPPRSERCTASQTRSRSDKPWSTGGMVVVLVVALQLQLQTKLMSPN